MAQKRSHHISVFGSRATSVVSVALVLILIGLVVLMSAAAHTATDNLRRNLGFTVKMERDAEAEKINSLKRVLSGAPFAETYVYAGADEILAQEAEIIGEDIMQLVDENPYGAEFDVRLRPAYACGDSIERIAARLEALPGVEDVLTDTGVIDSVNHNISRVMLVMLAVAAALLVISFVLINNTVSLAVYSRRFIIHTMRLVGATAAFIRRPFIAAGAVNGMLSAAVACVVLAAAQAWVMQSDPALASVLDWRVSAVIYAALVITGVLICLLASAIATTRYLRSDIDDYYMN
ncbi:MAG: permease-like cell division protein FtsX [Muribaculaceae bacterium]|nr:permease-like cell division protein FtsX [Muribaculaceae bacterium]